MSEGVPNPLDFPDLWDHFLLNGQVSPGQALVAGAGRPRKWDEQNGTGNSGATLKFNGEGLAEFSVELTFWETVHFDEWAEFKALLEPPGGTRPKALDIYHPALEDAKIKTVVVADVSQLTQDGDDGKWKVKIDFKQYREPKPAAAVPKGGQGMVGAQTGATSGAEDEYDKMIADLTKQLQDEAAQ